MSLTGRQHSAKNGCFRGVKLQRSLSDDELEETETSVGVPRPRAGSGLEVSTRPFSAADRCILLASPWCLSMIMIWNARMVF